jgi:hypothetical protein
MVNYLTLLSILDIYSNSVGYVEIRLLIQSLDRLELNLRIVNRQLDDLTRLCEECDELLDTELLSTQLKLQKASLENLYSM